MNIENVLARLIDAVTSIEERLETIEQMLEITDEETEKRDIVTGGID